MGLFNIFTFYICKSFEESSLNEKLGNVYQEIMLLRMET